MKQPEDYLTEILEKVARRQWEIGHAPQDTTSWDDLIPEAKRRIKTLVLPVVQATLEAAGLSYFQAGAEFAGQHYGPWLDPEVETLDDFDIFAAYQNWNRHD